MVNEYKRIVLLKGLAPISDDHFSLFKSLMASDLGMNRKKQKQCTRDEIADMMEDKFKDDAGLGKLIKFCEDLSVLKKRAGILKKERSKVIGETSLEINRQEAGPAMPTSTTSHTLASERGETSTAHAETSTDHAETSTAQAETSTAQPTNQNMARDAILQTEPLTVMVLNATESFEYGSSEHGVKNMFHATVATVDQYFHVKVLNINMIEKFTKNNWITISNYFQSKGILEINEESIVSQAAPDRNNEVPKDLIRHANDSPKICDIQKGATGAVFYGEFKLYKKKKMENNTIYEIKDYSGSMKVVLNGIHDIEYDEGDKLQLFCFHLETIEEQPMLVCGEHSFIKPPNQDIARDAILQTEPLTVMVLNATELFKYKSSDYRVKNMFHATVASVDQYFHVKVFNIDIKEKFTKNNWITISKYFEGKGFLAINEESSVSRAVPDRNNKVPEDLIRHANDSPKICDIKKGATGAVFYGEFKLYKKTMKRKKIFYEIKDYSGSMEVEMDRKCHDINCNEGDKLRLFCFYVKTMNKQKKLVCEDHSFIKVISAEEEAAAHSSTRSEE